MTDHPPHEADYLYRRAEQELEQAQRAAHPAAVKAHYILAGSYLDLIYGPDGAEAASRSSDREARSGA